MTFRYPAPPQALVHSAGPDRTQGCYECYGRKALEQLCFRPGEIPRPGV